MLHFRKIIQNKETTISKIATKDKKVAILLIPSNEKG